MLSRIALLGFALAALSIASVQAADAAVPTKRRVRNPVLLRLPFSGNSVSRS